MNQKIPYSRIDCSGKEEEYVKNVLESGWLTTASRAQELEERIGAMLGSKHAIGVNSCTSALHLALEALGVGKNDKVLVPTWTFTASAEVILYLGADPVLLDVDYGTSSLTPNIVEDALGRHPDAKAIIVVHFAGQAAQMLSKDDATGISQLCKTNGVAIVEDAAHAFPAKDSGEFVGSIGEVTCLSFYANKTMTTGEGGMLLTDDDAIAQRAKLMRLHGIDRDSWDRFTSDKPSWEYDILAPGFKYNMPDVNAAIGLAQLERLEEFRRARQRCAEYYIEHLSGSEALDLPAIRVPYEDHAWHIFPIVLTDVAQIDRNELINRLAEDGIGTSVHYKPLHRMTYYREKYNLNNSDYPSAEKLWKGCLSLPIYSLLSHSNLEYISSRILHYLRIRS